MDEIRPINANLLIKEVDESFCQNPHIGVIERRMHDCEHKHFLSMIFHQPTIDLEALQIVQNLRDENLKSERKADDLMLKIFMLESELKRVVNERNGLAAIVYKQCWKDCFLYENGVIKENCGLGYFNKHTRKCMLQEWSGCKNESEHVRLKEPEDYFIAKSKESK